MPAVSKKQQRFFGIVRAIQKGEMAPTTPETAKAAADMKKSDVKDFASTKHKKLPEKKVAKEATDFAQRDKIMKKAKPLHKHLYSRLHKKDTSGDVNETFTIDPKAHRQQQRAKKIRDRTKTGDEGSEIAKKKVKGPALFGEGKWSDKYKKSIDCNNPKGFSQRAHCQGKKKVSEATKYDRYDKEKKQFAKADRKMKFGKFYDKAKEAKNRLRPGEVKRYDKKLGRYISNKD